MRFLGTIVIVLAVVFLGALGFYYLRDGSLQSAGREMDKDLAGIDSDPEGPGFKKIIVRPQPVAGLDWVDASYASIHGRIAVRWEHVSGRFVLKASLPANTTATVFVPTRASGAVRESGAPAAQSAGVKFLRNEAGRDVFAVDSGVYSFEANW